jgi:hypothetical protein
MSTFLQRNLFGGLRHKAHKSSHKTQIEVSSLTAMLVPPKLRDEDGRGWE